MTKFPIFLFALLFPFMVYAQTARPIVTPVAKADTSPPAPVVLELFTSQGCSFCPPADKLMAEIIQQPGVIGLSCHVDYFGVKKNSLGKAFCTKRQNDYNRLIGTGPRYTPQLVVNGHMDMIGYEGGKISVALLKARGEKMISIPVQLAADGSYIYSLPQAPLGRAPVRLWMAVYDRPKTMTMTEGGNFGKKISYVNVVSRMSDLGTWAGQPLMQSINPMFTPDNAGLAVIAQNVQTGKIIAAGSIER